MMSGDDFHIREVLKRGRFYNILAAAATVFPAACWTSSPNLKSHVHLKPASERSLRASFDLAVTPSGTVNELTAVFSSFRAAQVKLLLFTRRLCVQTDAPGPPADPRSASLRPTKNQSET